MRTNIFVKRTLVFALATFSFLLPTSAQGATITANSGGGSLLRGLLNKDFWINIGANAVYDLALKGALTSLPGADENTNLTEAYFDSIGVESYVVSGAFAFYTDEAGKIADQRLDFSAGRFSSNLANLESRSSAQISGISKKGALYFGSEPLVIARTTTDFFNDVASVTFANQVLGTSTPVLTGETLYAGGYAFAYIDGEFESIPLDYEVLALKKKEVPEPLTMIASGLALGFGTLCQKEYAKKRKKN